jgi:3-(3-hydroxy-phenyl)propionate hydroxylase
LPAHVRLLRIGRDLIDEAGLFQQRYDARAGSAYLVRPDQHLCARFRRVEAQSLKAAVERALGWELAR